MLHLAGSQPANFAQQVNLLSTEYLCFIGKIGYQPNCHIMYIASGSQPNFAQEVNLLSTEYLCLANI